jgi:hypothetical protein
MYNNQADLNGCCTAMWKADAKTTTLLTFFPKKREKLESELDFNLRKKQTKCTPKGVQKYQERFEM